MASYIGHLANSFYAKPKAPRGSTFRPYLAPQSSAFGGNLGSRPGAAPSTPAPAGATASGTAPTTGALQGFTASPTGLPPDPAYQQQVAGIDKTTGDTIGGLDSQRTDYLSSAGYTATYDAQGNVTGVAVDPNNPYSQSAILRKNFQQAKTGNTTSYAAAGQLYAGSLQNAQNAATDNFQAADNSLTNGVIRFLHNNAGQINSARDTGETNKGIAFGQSVQAAPNNPLYTAASNGGVGSVGPNGEIATTAANGPLALVAQSPNSSVKLANGYSIIYPPGGSPYIVDAQGNRVTGRVG